MQTARRSSRTGKIVAADVAASELGLVDNAAFEKDPVGTIKPLLAKWIDQLVVDLGKELMAGNDTDREVDIAYLHGYFAGKKTSPILDIPAVTAQTERFFNFCLANPKVTVMKGYEKSVN